MLPGRGDAAERGVVVDAEMRAAHAAAAGLDERAAAPTLPSGARIDCGVSIINSS